MFETSIIHLLYHLIINIFLPIIPWVLFMWIFFGKKFEWVLLYVLSFFIGVGLIAATMFNMEFLHLGIGVYQYIWLIMIFWAIFTFQHKAKKKEICAFTGTLKIKGGCKSYMKSYKNLEKSHKILSILSLIFVGFFVLFSFLFNVNFPTYWDDSFWNWHKPVVHMYHDEGMQIFWEKWEILGKGRFWYPIYIPIYKTVVAKFTWWINDIYINIIQYLSFLFFLVFVFVITFKKTKHLFYSLLPLVLICGLPLTFFHAVEGYMEMLSVIYTILMIYYLYKYLEKENHDYLVLGFIFGFMLMNIKNEWLIVYFSWVVFALGTMLLLQKKLKSFLKTLWKNKKTLYSLVWWFAYIALPFLAVKQYYGLGFNQAAGESSGVGFSDNIHFEIFDYFGPIFLSQDNYNVVLILVIILWVLVIKHYLQKKKYEAIVLPVIAFVYIFIIFTLVFLLTENYKWVLSQTTVNRVFTMSFIILFSFSWLLFHEKTHQKGIFH